MRRNEEPIVVEDEFDNSLETVWAAITEIEHMREWYFENIPSFKPEVGHEVEFLVEAGERSFLHQWKISKVIPQKLIEYSWNYGGYSGDSFVTFELQENHYTKFRLTHTVTKDFPVDIPEFKRESGIAGWRYFINQRLKNYLKSIKS